MTQVAIIEDAIVHGTRIAAFALVIDSVQGSD